MGKDRLFWLQSQWPLPKRAPTQKTFPIESNGLGEFFGFGLTEQNTDQNRAIDDHYFGAPATVFPVRG